MSKAGRELTDDEKKLWRRVAARVKARRAPLPELQAFESQTTEAVSSTRHPTAPVGEPRRAASMKASAAPPQNRGAEKRVRRGRVDAGGTLDLHGHNQNTAQPALERFLLAAQHRGARAVIVITGVGRGGQGVLKRRLPEWLAELRPIVSGFAQAHQSHGGEGAFYVFIRARHTNSP